MIVIKNQNFISSVEVTEYEFNDEKFFITKDNNTNHYYMYKNSILDEHLCSFYIYSNLCSMFILTGLSISSKFRETINYWRLLSHEREDYDLKQFNENIRGFLKEFLIYQIKTNKCNIITFNNVDKSGYNERLELGFKVISTNDSQYGKDKIHTMLLEYSLEDENNPVPLTVERLTRNNLIKVNDTV